MSTPCQTNSKADASNRNRQCGYRDWRSPHCKPLPVGMGKGFTTHAHRALALLHDRLEKKVIRGIEYEAKHCATTFSAENPVGALQRKQHMKDVACEPHLRTHVVEYCAFGGHYRKSTHLFHNMCDFQPCGTTGNGRCGRQGKNGRGACPVGAMVQGRFKHNFTIARESDKEFVSAATSRKTGKNQIPELLTKEMTDHATTMWLKQSTSTVATKVRSRSSAEIQAKGKEPRKRSRLK